MTREEATKILQTCKYSLIDTLEALGLIKFDEPETAKPKNNPFRGFGITDDNLKALEAGGYHIVVNVDKP